MKRSNRLILLIGIFLAVVAFVLILITLQNGSTSNNTVTPTTTPVVKASTDIALGSKITADMLKVEQIAIADKPANGYGDTGAVIGQTARMNVTAGGFITSDVINASSSVTNIEVPAGKVAIAIQVDQVSGVGTIIKSGDFVDMVVALTGDKFPVVTLNPTDKTVTVVSGINSTSVKLLLQGGQVLGTLLPPPTADNGTTPQASPGTGATTLNGQQEIVIVAVTAQQAEVVKYSQVDGNISLLLRSADDFRDPVTGLPLDPKLIVPATTSGITLKGLVDNYGVLVPQLVEAILPAK